MKTAAIVVAASSLFGAASAQAFTFHAQTYWGTPGDFWGPYETYYGDGNMYVGPGKVPADLNEVSDYTSEFQYHFPVVCDIKLTTLQAGDWTSTIPDIRFEAKAPGTLPANTFLVINNGTGATEPLVFSTDESLLGEFHINKWLRWGTFIVPDEMASGDVSTETHFYLEPTEEEETFRVTWRTPGTPDEGLQRVNITGIL